MVIIAHQILLVLLTVVGIVTLLCTDRPLANITKSFWHIISTVRNTFDLTRVGARFKITIGPFIMSPCATGGTKAIHSVIGFGQMITEGIA